MSGPLVQELNVFAVYSLTPGGVDLVVYIRCCLLKRIRNEQMSFKRCMFFVNVAIITWFVSVTVEINVSNTARHRFIERVI